jgi:hypothetical protein
MRIFATIDMSAPDLPVSPPAQAPAIHRRWQRVFLIGLAGTSPAMAH